MFYPAVGAGPAPGPTGALSLLARGGTVSHSLAGVVADFGLGAGCGLGCSLTCSLDFGCCSSCWRFSGPSSQIVSACWEAASPPPSVLAVTSLAFSLPSWPGATPFMTFAIMFMMPTPHSLSSSWRASHFCSLSCIHLIIPYHSASSQAARTSHSFARYPTVRCSCASSCACCRIVLSMRLFQSLRAAGASLLRPGFPFSFLSIGSNMVAPALSAGMDVAAVAISIATSIGASLLPSAASPASRSLLPLTLDSVVTQVRHAS